MTDEPSPFQRAEARALAKKRRTKGFERREAIFDLFVSGFSHQQIAKALGTSAGAVRRILDSAVAARPLDATERDVRVQVARLMKALSHADFKLEKGDIRAFGPYMKIISGARPLSWARACESSPAPGSPRRRLARAAAACPDPRRAAARPGFQADRGRLGRPTH
jgi:predicted transcriptional regulator